MLHRLLMAGGGGGGSFAPPFPTVHALTSSPNGGWAIPNPAAYQYNGYVYFGWVTHSGAGPVKVAAVPLSTYVTGAPITVLASPGSGIDDHNNPSMIVDSVSHKLVVAYCDHVDIRMRVRVSVNSLDSDPTLSGGFTAEWHGAEAPINTYAMLVQLRGITDSPIYLFLRDLPNTSVPTTTRFSYYRSIDLFATDPVFTRLFTAGTGQRAYWDIGSDWDSRIDVVTTQGDPASGGVAGVTLNHFYIDGTDETYHQSDGTAISAGLPFTTADMTEVYDGADGTPFPAGTVTDALGPACLFLASGGVGVGHATRQARYRSGAWGIVEILDTTGYAVSPYWPGACTDPFDADRIWTARLIGSYFELSEFRSGDDGTTWAEGVVTSGSSAHNTNPEPVVFGTDDLLVIWLHGPADDYDIYGLER